MKEDTYYARNREKILEKAKKYREENKEYYNIYYREWYKLNKEKLYEKRKQARPPRPPRQRKVPVTVEAVRQGIQTVIPQETVKQEETGKQFYTVSFK